MMSCNAIAIFSIPLAIFVYSLPFVSFVLQTVNPADAITRAALTIADFFYGNWHRILISVAILVIAFVLTRVLKGLIVGLGKTYQLPPQTARMFVTLMTYVVLIAAIVSVMAVFDIQLYPLILSLGILSVVVVLGSQLLISNMLGGAVVYIEKPFPKAT